MIRYQRSAPITIGAIELVIVTRVEIERHVSGTVCWLRATKTPWAIVLRDGNGARAFDLTGQRVPLAEVDDRAAAQR